MLIANTLGSVADKIFSQPVEQFDALTAWTGAFAYSLQLFYDFSGYSDMAIGLGMIFGFRFWRTSIIRTYRVRLRSSGVGGIYRCRRGLGVFVYTARRNRVEKWRMYVNLFIVFLATGLWHGAEWTFVIWGYGTVCS